MAQYILNRYHTPNIYHTDTYTYLVCVLSEDLSGEPMALQVIEKINTRLKFLNRKNRFLTQIMCYAIIQPRFDCAGSV